MIRQFTTPVLIRLKPEKAQISLPNRAESLSGYVSVALVCLFVSRIKLRPTRKVMNGF